MTSRPTPANLLARREVMFTIVVEQRTATTVQLTRLTSHDLGEARCDLEWLRQQGRVTKRSEVTNKSRQLLWSPVP